MPPMPRPRRARGLSLYALTTLLVMTALLYVAGIGIHIATRFRPAVEAIVRDSEISADRFEDFRRRAAHHDLLIKSLWAQWRMRRDGVTPPDSLEAIRRSLQRFAIERPPGHETLFPLSSSPDFSRVMERAVHAEEELRASLIGVIAALELNDQRAAGILLSRADSLDTPLAAAMAEATELAMNEVRRREQELLKATDEGSRIILLWLFVGVLVFPVAAEMLRRRLQQPLQEIGRGLDRLSSGDLAVEVEGEGDDELGRLARNINRTAEVLRERTEATEQEAAQRSLLRARSLMDAALDAVVVVDRSGAIREWNPQANAMFGWEREQMLGVNFSSLLFPVLGGDPSAAQRLSAVLAGDAAALRQRLRASARRGDGSFVSIELGITQLDSPLEPEYAVFIRDVSGEEAARQALMESESRYRATFDQSVLGKVELDLDGTVIRANPVFLDIVRRSAKQVYGKSFKSLLPANQAADDLKDFDDLRAGRVAEVRREREYLGGDGRSRWISTIATAVRDTHGRVGFFLVAIQDITARVELERELRHAHKMDAVGQLAGGVAHDFNNILAGIIGYADLLEHEVGATDSIRHEARAIVATAQRGADLAQKLLALARELPTTLVELDARDVVHEVHGIIKRAFDRNVEIRVDLDELPIGVRADRTQLSNAVLNLALNARDAMPLGGRLTLRARRVTLDATSCDKFVDEIAPGEYAAIVISDTGTGMTREVLARIFDPFFTTKEHGKGTGLGLAMVYGMVRAHEGVVDVESVVGVGSTFSIYLPVVKEMSPVVAAPAAPELFKGKGEVLLADDETTVREVATRMLQRLGYKVEAVSDGAQAVARFRAEPDRFAVVLLDGDMPRMHGREAARLMREIRPDATVFLATGYLTSGPQAEYATLFNAVLSKPYTLQDLSRVLSAHSGSTAATL